MSGSAYFDTRCKMGARPGCNTSMPSVKSTRKTPISPIVVIWTRDCRRKGRGLGIIQTLEWLSSKGPVQPRPPGLLPSRRLAQKAREECRQRRSPQTPAACEGLTCQWLVGAGIWRQQQSISGSVTSTLSPRRALEITATRSCDKAAHHNAQQIIKQ